MRHLNPVRHADVSQPHDDFYPPGQLSGHLSEVSGDNTCARTTMAIAALLQAQGRGEPTAWVQFVGGALYPPDLALNGVDLRSLAVVRIPSRAGYVGLFKATELLLRSGGIGMVVVDFGGAQRPVICATAWQGRLSALAREHRASVLFITDKTLAMGSLGPLVSLRLQPQRLRRGRCAFAVQCLYVKNKLGLQPAPPLLFQAPWGLR